jgi:hypothetical protein
MRKKKNTAERTHVTFPVEKRITPEAQQTESVALALPE